MAWRIAKMIVNDVMQQAQCEQPLEKVTKVRGVELSVSEWRQPAGRAELSPLEPTLVNVQTTQRHVKKQSLEAFQPVCDVGIS